jgi:hypothetical protein
LAREFPDGITGQNIRDLAAEIERRIHQLKPVKTTGARINAPAALP